MDRTARTITIWRRLLLMAAGSSLLALIVLITMWWVGTSAIPAPGHVETEVARTVRNLSIPWLARTRKNPLANDAAALVQGRQLFERHCSTCHGLNGEGHTQIGGGVYPRVPDLRAARTQNLTDGEIDYIIENGVRLTGMPALAHVHQLSPTAGWKLVLYIRSLKPRTASRNVVQANTLATAHYVGSAACARCHQNIYQRWRKTPMANVVRNPAIDPGAYLQNPASNTVAPFKPGQVALVYGSLWKQRFFTRVGNNLYPLPVQWDIGAKKWLPYHSPSVGADWWVHLYPDSNMERPTGPTCDGCHSVGYNIQTHQVAEWNVGCERCHGPGSIHVAHPTADNVINPARLSTVAENDTCIQCHSQGRPITPIIQGKPYDWPVGYQVGLRLQDFWRLEKCTLGQSNFYYYPDCTAHKNRMQGNDFVQSVMYRHGITCADCHDVHGTPYPSDLVAPLDNNQLCLNCHGAGSPNGPQEATIAEHTHHPDGSSGSQCIACHMPQIENEGVPGVGTNEMVHAHTFRFITPAMTDAEGIPNPCTTCHTHKSTAWATAKLAQWNDRSPWHVPFGPTPYLPKSALTGTTASSLSHRHLGPGHSIGTP